MNIAPFHHDQNARKRRLRLLGVRRRLQMRVENQENGILSTRLTALWFVAQQKAGVQFSPPFRLRKGPPISSQHERHTMQPPKSTSFCSLDISMYMVLCSASSCIAVLPACLAKTIEAAAGIQRERPRRRAQGSGLLLSSQFHAMPWQACVDGQWVPMFVALILGGPLSLK